MGYAAVNTGISVSFFLPSRNDFPLLPQPSGVYIPYHDLFLSIIYSVLAVLLLRNRVRFRKSSRCSVAWIHTRGLLLFVSAFSKRSVWSAMFLYNLQPANMIPFWRADRRCLNPTMLVSPKCLLFIRKKKNVLLFFFWFRRFRWKCVVGLSTWLRK